MSVSHGWLDVAFCAGRVPPECSRWTPYLFVLFTPPGVRTQPSDPARFSVLPGRQPSLGGGLWRFWFWCYFDAGPIHVSFCHRKVSLVAWLGPKQHDLGSLLALRCKTKDIQAFTSSIQTLKVGPHCLLSPILMAHKLECRLHKGFGTCCVSWA